MPQTRFFYGWVIVGITFVVQFANTGFVFYAFGLALKDMTDEFGASRTAVSSVYGVLPWVGALMAPFIGRWSGEGRTRLLLTLGTAAIGLGLVLVSWSTQLWHLYVIFPTLLAFGANTTSGVAAAAIVVNWFDHARAQALGISQIGASAGGMIMAPVAMSLIASSGWRDIYLLFGLISLALVPGVWFCAVGRPDEMGLRPDGVEPNPAANPTPVAAPTPPRVSLGFALRQRNLWLIAFVTGVGFSYGSAVVTHGAALASDLGVQGASIGWLLSLFSSGALVGKPLFGWIADRFGERQGFYISLALQLAGVLGLMAAEDAGALFAAVPVVGLGVGGILPLSGAIVARAFGPESFGPMMGFLWPLMTPLFSAGVPLAGWSYDQTGSYNLAFGVFAVAIALAAVAVARIELPARA